MAFTSIRQRDPTKSSGSLQSLETILRENRLPTGGLTRFANVLLHIARHLTKEEFSLMKLALIANDDIKAKNSENISCSADLLSFMYLRKLINKNDVSLLMELLVKIQRQDLLEVIKELYNFQHRSGMQEKPLSISTQQKEVSVSSNSGMFGVQCSSSKETIKDSNPDSMDDEDDLPNSQNSQSSLSDDAKMDQLEKKKMIEVSVMDTNIQ